MPRVHREDLPLLLAVAGFTALATGRWIFRHLL